MSQSDFRAITFDKKEGSAWISVSFIYLQLSMTALHGVQVWENTDPLSGLEAVSALLNTSLSPGDSDGSIYTPFRNKKVV